MLARERGTRRSSLVVILVVVCLFVFAPLETAAQYRVIWDDDGEMSGLLALMLFLAHPDFEVIATTVSPGEAVPAPYASRLASFLEQLGYGNIRVAYGASKPILGDNAFPEPWRKGVTSFMNLDLCGLVCPHPLPWSIYPEPNAGQIIGEALAGMDQTGDLVLFVAGPLTNVYEAFSVWTHLEPQGEIEDTAQQFLNLEIMGGAVEVAGNLTDWQGWVPPNDKAEWNIWIDPHAAASVFSGPAHVYLSPLDVTNAVVWDGGDVAALQAFGTCFASFAATLLEKSIGLSNGMAWDLTAAAMTIIRLAEGGTVTDNGHRYDQPIDDHCLDVDTFPPNEGWTRKCCGIENVSVYTVDSLMDSETVKAFVIETFGQWVAP